MDLLRLWGGLMATVCLHALSTPPLYAAVLRVGPGGVGAGCTHDSLAAAIEDAGRDEDADVIHLVDGVTADAQALRIEGQDLHLIGGFEHCGDDVPGLGRSTVSGFGGTRRPVFTIRGPGVVRLEGLDIVRGDTGTSGGGINYIGNGAPDSENTLILARTRVHRNAGGGISFIFAGSRPATLVLDDDVEISDNEAWTSGGAIFLAGDVRLAAIGDRVAFERNIARRHGGAIFIQQPANADFRASGDGRAPVFRENHAHLDGGAIFVDAPFGAGEAMRIDLAGTAPDRPALLTGNRADARGGAIAVSAVAPPAGDPSLVAICATHVNLIGNRAPHAAALWLDRGHYGECDAEPVVLGMRHACVPASTCGRIEANVVESASGSAFELFGASVDLQFARILNNRPASALFHLGQSGTTGSVLALRDSLVAGTEFSANTPALFDLDGGVIAHVGRSTIASNFMQTPQSDNAVFRIDGPGAMLSLEGSIVHQPGATAIAGDTGGAALQYMLLHEIPPGYENDPTVIAASPQFATDHDFLPGPASPALDFAPESPRSDAPHDLDGLPRSVDHPTRENRFGPVDLGAFEVQASPHAPLFSNGFED